MNAYDIAGFLTGLICVILTVRNSWWNWPWGLLNAAIFLFEFWRAGLFADSALQIVYVILGAYGWWAWQRGGKSARPLPISHISRRGALVAIAVFVVMTAVFATVLAHALGSTVPLADGATTALSLIAEVLLTRRVFENWWLWMTADIIHIPLYIYKGLPLTSFLDVIFLGLCIAGVIAWRRDYRRQLAA